ncbi:hypothetical protein CHS0354_013450 [Potamilus streckersoni]|uniref:NACHT domain-containing protein n=1 Tax=Potamilus streckersoni TaxID=2493646 RepID=A0AAE0RYN6_9BIVA|nr:hypothetical protein CHS0354_013450 [Potamilus streckersoni]
MSIDTLNQGFVITLEDEYTVWMMALAGRLEEMEKDFTDLKQRTDTKDRDFIRMDFEVTNLSHALDQLKTNVDCMTTIKTTLDVHNEKIGSISEKVKDNFVSVISNLKECETKFNILNEQLSELNLRLNHFDLEHKEIGKQSVDHIVQLKDHTTQILNLDSKVESHGILLQDLESQIWKQSYQLNEHDEEIKKEGDLIRDHDSQIKKHEDKIQAQRSILDNLKLQIQDTDDQLKDHVTKFSDHCINLQTSESQLRHMLKEYDAKNVSQETKLGDHEAQIQSQESRLNVQDGSIQLTSTMIDCHETQIKDHDIQLEEVKVQLHQQTTKISDHDARIIDLESDKKVTHQEIERLRDDLLSRYKSFRTIPISPLGDGDGSVPLNEFYTDVFIESNNLEQTSQDSDISQRVQNTTNEELSLRSLNQKSHAVENKEKTKKEQLVSFKQLFAGRKRERIILTGLSGCGKSTFCRKIVNTWCEVQSKLNGNISAKTVMFMGAIADEDVLLEFDLLFYINSARISKGDTLCAVLQSQCIQTTEGQLARILGTQPDKILFIFDGIDEMGDQQPAFMKDLLKRKLYPRITLILVMRPWRISALHLNPLSHYDLILEIRGFSEDNAIKFVKQVIDLRNNDTTQSETIGFSDDDQKVFTSFRNVPLLLLFLGHLWCRNRSLPKKRQELYKQLLDYLMERCLKKMKTKYADVFSDSDNRTPRQVFWESYLQSACKFAHDCLLRKEGGPSVVMQEEHVLLNLGANSHFKLNALLDCGIITKVDFCSPLEKNVSISFLHLSIQEYLASMHIVDNEDAFQKFLASWMTLNDICRHENLIVFICGIDARHGQVFNRICQVCNEDLSVLHYRKDQNNDLDVNRAIRNLNEIYRSCLHEIDDHADLEISDVLKTFMLDPTKYSRLKHEAVKSMNIAFPFQHNHGIDMSSFSHLNSLILMYIDCEECSNNMCKNIGVLSTLTTLSLCSVTMNEECCKSLCSGIGVCTHLEIIKLSCLNLHDNIFNLANFTELTAFEMSHVTMSQECCKSLCKGVGTCTHLKSLLISGIALHDGVLNLRGLVNLTIFTLSQVTMSDECCTCVCSSIKFCTQLEKIILSDMILHQGVLDIDSLTKLKLVEMQKVVISEECGWRLCASVSSFTYLENLHLLQLILHSGVLEFRNQKCLRSIAMNNISISNECGISLCSSISAGTDLEKLTLSNITLQDGVLDLSSMIGLTSVTLMSITMSDECATSLCSTIGSCTHLQNLNFTNVALHSGILDLNNLTRLVTLKFDDVKMSSDCSDTFCSSISACSQLENLSLKHITLHNSVIYFTSLNNLISVCLDNVTMSAKCSMSVCKLICSSDTIRKLCLEYITLHDGILCLSSLTRLTDLKLWYVTMAKECTLSVYNTIVSCSFLNSLCMSIITLDEGVLHMPIDFQCLNSLTSLEYLNLRNVFIPWENVRARCLGVKDGNRFQNLTLSLLRSSDGYINLKRLIKLSKLTGDTHSKHLTLRNITISSDYSESKCSCINVTLSYSGINSQDGLMYMSDFKSLREFTSLTLENVIASEESTRSLCCSINACIQLHELLISHINIYDSRLDLKLLKKLKILVLKSACMSVDCSKSLCESISKCTLLEKLHLEKISLQDGILTMDGLKNLKSLKLKNVTMCPNYYILLSCSLSGCGQIIHLEIEGTKLVRIQEGNCNNELPSESENFSLNGLNSLTTLALENIRLSEEFFRSLSRSSDICKNLETLKLNNATLYSSHVDFSNLVALKSLRLAVNMPKSNKPLGGNVNAHFPTTSAYLQPAHEDADSPDVQNLVKFIISKNLTSFILGGEFEQSDLNEHLFDVVNTSTHLQTLSIYGIKLKDSMLLNLIVMSHLSELQMLNVNISEECARSLCRSIKFCILLKTLLLFAIKLYDGVLDLKNLYKLKMLRLTNVIMSEECSRSLLSSIRALISLQDLQLESITEYEGVLELKGLLELSAQNHLTNLKVSGINMSFEQSKSFCDSIRVLTQLQILEIVNISLSNGSIDLRILTQLTSLIMKKVRMSVECRRSLCSSINECTKLREIRLSDFQLCDGVLDLSKLIRLTSLTLNNLWLMPECSRSLCRSISACTCLESLNLFEMNLYDGVLDLHRLGNLTTFSQKNVVWSCESRCILKESLKHCPKLMESNIKITDYTINFGESDDQDCCMNCKINGRMTSICCCCM